MDPTVSCPAPIARRERILLGHGGGGRLMQELIASVFRPAFENPALETRHDGAVLRLPGSGARLAFTTDSYVVRPLFFPGGDIGSLSVNGTVNDLAMCGARPLWLSCGLILEEGVPMETVERVAASMRRAADAAGVAFVTGDTKVVDKGKGDGVFVNTAGIGVVEHSRSIGPTQVRAGDRLIVSGDLGRHGISILAARESLGFETSVESDCAPLAEPVLALIEAGVEASCLRDLTRGGLGAALDEIARDAGLHVAVEESSVPVSGPVSSACELLGLDPFHVANEGRFLAFVPPAGVERALQVLRRFPVTQGACVVGEARTGRAGLVTARTDFGTVRVLDLPSGEQLPRIC